MKSRIDRLDRLAPPRRERRRFSTVAEFVEAIGNGYTPDRTDPDQVSAMGIIMAKLIEKYPERAP